MSQESGLENEPRLPVNQQEQLELRVLYHLNMARHAGGVSLTRLRTYASENQDEANQVIESLFNRGLLAKDKRGEMYAILQEGRQYLNDLGERHDIVGVAETGSR